MGSRALRIGLIVAAVVLLAGGVWGAVWWAMQPRVPDIRTVDIKEASRFIGSNDFNRLSESRRKQFVLGLVDRLKEKNFKDLVGMVLGGDDRKQIGQNINRLSKADREEIGGAFFRTFLDKFFALSKTDQDVYYTTWVMMEKLGQYRRPTSGPSTRPGGLPPLPSPQQAEKMIAQFLSHQPPKTAAQASQMMNMMRRKRELLGVKQPW